MLCARKSQLGLRSSTQAAPPEAVSRGSFSHSPWTGRGRARPPGRGGGDAGKAELGGSEKHVSRLNVQAVRGQTQGRPALLMSCPHLPVFHTEGETSEAPQSSGSRNLL